MTGFMYYELHELLMSSQWLIYNISRLAQESWSGANE